ncbi:DNA polymerase III subunit alpha [Candidatus Enterococcus murrayae]|uniref:DNA polymerase III subunit alpha n=1 Tax=Candidatus Enterococcus murrayae TaxID=2815321 RepID=A0ABS3HL77_9ENTE|nr:DNA polymerase III subunit alpha [Enterococcus sp. MJM16]MBO0453704.1 DNA polymerase III subunit alpha [Enterococcus sp. MJM16]
MILPQLYTKTSYSLLKSTLTISDYVEMAKARGYTAIAITDENVLYGAVEFFQACQRNQMIGIIGLELDFYLEEATERILFYAKNVAGYQELMRLSSTRMMAEKPQSLSEYKIDGENVVTVLPVDALNEPREPIIAKIAEAINGEIYLGISPETKTSVLPEGFPTIAIHEVAYLDATQAFAIKVMGHIQNGSQLPREELTNQLGDSYLVEMEELLAGFDDKEAVMNAQRLVETCQFELPLHQKLLPHYPVPIQQTADAYLQKLCWEKLPERIPEATEEYRQRLTRELGIIHSMGFDDYFLIVWDVMDYVHRSKIVSGAGRGSAAGSLVAYVLSITDVDPIKYNLLFERFLNPERNSMPDIDLDIPDNRRNQVLHYVHEKYGHFHVSQIATFGTMAAKMVLRDVGRVFGLSQSEANRWSKAIPNQLKITLREAYEKSEPLKRLVANDERSNLLFQTALALEGLPRHVSTHAGGVVISDMNLLGVVPLQNGSEDILLTQFTMTDVETIGLLKMDFLGLRNLSIIDNALQNVRRIYREELNLKNVPLDDPATLALFQRGETSGVFQFESAGIRKVLRNLHPTSFEDIVAVNALYRPGPMQIIDQFIARKNGKEPVTFPDASVQQILAPTYGFIVYQEQIMQVAAQMAGFSLGEADILRRAVSKKKKDLLDEERRHFVSGAVGRGHSQKSAEEVYDYIERFANYGFNRSHSVAYSFVGYQMAYLKVHYPGAFYTALMQSVRNDPKKLREYIAEANRSGVKLLAPDINRSSYSFTLVEKALIRFGLDAIKGMRRDFVGNILATRKAEGPFKSLDQFLLRIESRWLKIDYIAPLIFIGAFDELHPNRRELADGLEGKIQNVEYSGGSMSLLDVMSLKERPSEDYSLAERLNYEEHYLGLYVSGHPTENFPKLLKQKDLQPITELTVGSHGKILFYLKEVREIRTKKGEQMAFLTGNDQSGEVSLTIFPQSYRRLRKDIELEKVYLVQGKVERSRYDQAIQLLVEEMVPAQIAEDDISDKTLYLRVQEKYDTPEIQQGIAERLQLSPGKIPVLIYYEKSRRKIVLDKKFWVGVNDTLLNALSDILGEQNVVIR